MPSDWQKRRDRINQERDPAKRGKVFIKEVDAVLAEYAQALAKVEKVRQEGFRAIEKKYRAPSRPGQPRKRERLQ